MIVSCMKQTPVILGLMILTLFPEFLKSCLEFLCGTFYNLFNEELRDKLKFVFNPDVILCGWLGS